MQITFTLSDEQFTANDRQGVMVGLPLAVQLDAGALILGQDGATSGWFERIGPGQKLLQPFSLERSVFSGQIGQLETWRGPEGVLCQALLDCGLPIRLDVLDPDLAADAAGTPYDLQVGDWLLGAASLSGLLALSPGDLLWQPVQGAIVDVQRLVMNPLSPQFGTLRWLQSLPRQSFLPDQVFVSIRT